MRLVVAKCSVDYTGRLTAHLPLATRLLIVKADGSVLVHSDGGSYKPLNWMSPPCRLRVTDRADAEDAAEDAAATLPEEDWVQEWDVVHDKTGDRLRVRLVEILQDTSIELGIDPGLQKDGVEAHLQALLAQNIETLGEDWSLVRREYPTAIGPVDILARDADGGTVAIEIKRRGEIDGVEQLTRYLELLNRDPLLAPVRGMFAAQAIKPQAKVLAGDRGIDCVTLDYDALRGIDDAESRLF
ncbi:endonuclease NucS [Brachybacterium endophyticum]|uniref:Endonuclease NucS n=1 Tax=Brachybacterium endophyticum TaxID=2182385 RepID=A0A2U2RIC1_9MICO|nr:endonuclease NucS [Brachybacterium endophyticum]PWH05606.1 endonuclease NucS [Brachybacterium endophyticum]